MSHSDKIAERAALAAKTDPKAKGNVTRKMKPGDVVTIGEVEVTFMSFEGGSVSISFRAPKTMEIRSFPSFKG